MASNQLQTVLQNFNGVTFNNYFISKAYRKLGNLVAVMLLKLKMKCKKCRKIYTIGRKFILMKYLIKCILVPYMYGTNMYAGTIVTLSYMLNFMITHIRRYSHAYIHQSFGLKNYIESFSIF